MKYLCVIGAILLALTPALASAQRGGGARGGGGMRGGGGGAMRGGGARPAGGGGARPSGGGGFNFSHDTGPRSPRTRPSGGGGNFNNANHGNGNYNGNRNNGNNYNRNGNINRNNGNNYNRNGNTYVNNGNINRTVVNNPVYGGGGAWGWNHGVAWAPAPYYWGGGFWGAMAVGVTSAAVYGSIVANNQTYYSYQVQPSTPGYTFLSNYQLSQVQCGPSGLVVVYGPQDSVICATPNQHVAAGTYQLNTETLSLTPM